MCAPAKQTKGSNWPGVAGNVGCCQWQRPCLSLGPQEAESEMGILEKMIYGGSVLRRKEA